MLTESLQAKTLVTEALSVCGSFLKSHIGAKEEGVNVIKIKDGKSGMRDVKYMLPKGKPPRNGWPVVFVFQGSFFPVQFFRSDSEPAEIYYESVTIQRLLAEGFAVVAPKALAGLAWQTNAPHFRKNYKESSDYQMMKNLLKAVQKGQLGALDSKSLFAVGISSGGYNTSRMAVSFPNKFKALVVHSASYATCLGPICNIPDQLDKKHPPTLLLTGEKDKVVSPKTTIKYYEALERDGIPTELYINEGSGHGWFEASPDLVVNWFKSFK